jgi:hypothetical protein
MALPLPAAAQADRPREVLALLRPDGACSLHWAPPGTHAAARASLAGDAAALQALGGRLLADAAAMRLAPARENVPRFGDWAYGWVQSYVTSYRILARGLMGVAQSVAVEGEAPLVARLAEEMAAPIRAEFETRVLAPALAEGGYGADLAYLGAVLDADWAAALARATAPIAALPPASGAAGALSLNLAAAAQPLALAAQAPSDPMALLAEEGADTGTVFLRSMRPMAARLGAVVVRISEAGSIVATGGAFGYALGGFPGTALGLVGGIGASWAIDWALNKVDSTLHRGAFEAQALEAIGRAEVRLAEAAEAVLAEALAARLAALETPGACP